MNNYQFIKNTKWKTVEVNGEDKDIPEDWNVDKVSDLFDIKRGKVLSKDYIQENKGCYPVYSSATENKGCIGSINTYMFDGEYLTWTTDGIYAGTVFYRNGKFNSTNICGVLDRKKELNLHGLYFFVKEELIKHVNHIGNSKLMSNVVSDIELLYPTCGELVGISKVLSQQESLIETTEKLIAKHEQRLRYLSNELLSGRLRVREQEGEIAFYKNTKWKTVEVNGEDKEIPEDWDVSKIRNFFNSYIGGEYGIDKPASDLEKVNVFTLHTFAGKKHPIEIRYLKKSKLKNRNLEYGDILLEKSGGTTLKPVGRLYQFKEKNNDYYSAVNFINILKPSSTVDKLYLFKLLKFYYDSGITKDYENKTTNIANLDIEQYMDHALSYQPCLNNQALLFKVLSQQESLIESLKQSLEQEKKKFQFLLDNLLSGKYLVETV